MTRETERWQEQMRYAMDAGVLPPLPRRRGRRFLLASLGVGSALIAFASYAGRGPAEAPRIDPVVEPSQNAAAPAALEQTRRRSFTRNLKSEPTDTVTEPAMTASAVRTPVNVPDPATTGGISTLEEAPRQNAPAASAESSKRPTLRQARLSSERKGVEAPPRVKRQAEARRSAGGKRTAERAGPRSFAERPRPERAAVAAPTRTVSVCLYFVVCL